MATINCGSIRACLCHILAFMGSCFGCCINSTLFSTADEPSKGLRIQAEIVNEPIISDVYWSTSTCDLDVQSLRNASFISTSNPTLNQSCDFVNHGFHFWNQSRLQWIGSGKSEVRTPRGWKLRSGWNGTYKSLLTNKKPFRHPIPLREMVDFLVDVWEHEGLYD